GENWRESASSSLPLAEASLSEHSRTYTLAEARCKLAQRQCIYSEFF
ncbi:hypothetical protein A2U01_0099082, partial [Trifolium medium]|nr:hypothetical protein [Trifolium medium]